MWIGEGCEVGGMWRHMDTRRMWENVDNCIFYSLCVLKSLYALETVLEACPKDVV